MKKVTIYTTRTCPFCRASRHLMKERGIAFEEIDVTNDLKIQESLICQTGLETVPQIFFGNKFIGGFEELKAMDERGELGRLLKKAA